MRSDSLNDREPCPWRIVDDIGGAFCMGAIGGSGFHIIRGAWNAPKNSRIMGATNAMTARGPVLGGQFAVWGGIFACCDCTLTAIRQKEDPWNSIVSGAATGGILAARAGPKAAAQAAAVGGVLLALIEGMGIMMTKMFTPAMPTPEEMAAMGAQDPLAPPTTGGIGLSSMATAPPPSEPSTSAGSSESEPSSTGLDPFAILAGGGGGNSSSSSGGDNFDSFGSETTFSSGSSNVVENDKKGWWSFGSK